MKSQGLVVEARPCDFFLDLGSYIVDCTNQAWHVFGATLIQAYEEHRLSKCVIACIYFHDSFDAEPAQVLEFGDGLINIHVGIVFDRFDNHLGASTPVHVKRSLFFPAAAKSFASCVDTALPVTFGKKLLVKIALEPSNRVP